MIRDIERVGKPNRRIGTRERDMHTEYVNEAYAGGYLDDEELGDPQGQDPRREVREGSAETCVDDLPSYAELKGRKNVPVKAEKRMFWLINLYRRITLHRRGLVRVGVAHRDCSRCDLRVDVPYQAGSRSRSAGSWRSPSHWGCSPLS